MSGGRLPGLQTGYRCPKCKKFLRKTSLGSKLLCKQCNEYYDELGKGDI